MDFGDTHTDATSGKAVISASTAFDATRRRPELPVDEFAVVSARPFIRSRPPENGGESVMQGIEWLRGRSAFQRRSMILAPIARCCREWSSPEGLGFARELTQPPEHWVCGGVSNPAPDGDSGARTSELRRVSRPVDGGAGRR